MHPLPTAPKPIKSDRDRRRLARAVGLNVAVGLVTIVVAGCSDNEGSTAPVAEQPLATAEIGPGAGILAAAGFALEVPAGAFDGGAVSLRLYAAPEEDGFGERAATDVYRLEGLPSAFVDTLRLRLRSRGNLTADPFLAIGIEEQPANRSAAWVWRYLPAVEVEGELIGRLPPPVSADRDKLPAPDRLITAVTGR